MNYHRVTVSFPTSVYEDLSRFLGKGRVSRFVAEATQEKLLERKLSSKDPVAAFFAHKKTLPKLTDREIMTVLKKGRM